MSLLSPLPSTAERALAMSIVQLPETVESATEALQPHIVCDHVHTLAQRFHGFYSACRVLDGAIDGSVAFQRRVLLCAAADTALRTAFKLLGITTVDRL